MANASALPHHCDGQEQKRLPDRALAELARLQHGVVCRAQLTAIGLTRGVVELRLRRGRLHRVHRGVYAVGHELLTKEGRWMAAVLAGGPGAVLSHASAAALWGLRSPGGAGFDVTSARQLRSRPGLRFRCLRLPCDEVTRHDGIPVTTVPRTLFDLAGEVPRHQLERALNEAEVLRLWDPLSLQELLVRHPRRPGAARLRAVVAAMRAGATVTRSELEARFLGFLDAESLPRPATNVAEQLGGVRIEADCVWREQRLIVELDGHAAHGTRAAYESDRARDRRLTATGWRVVRVTWRQLHVEPAALARDLRAALAYAPAGRGRAANLPPA